MWKFTAAHLLALSLVAGAHPLFAAEEQEKTSEQTEESTEIYDEYVVTASKKKEKRLQAPATIENVSQEDLKRSGGLTYYDTAGQAKGVDMVNAGLNHTRLAGRGFAESYKTRMLYMVDGRLAQLPGGGIPQANLSPTVDLDIQSIEILLGPATALYGPDATGGALNVITKTPWDESGFALSQKLGDQSTSETQLRYADTSDSGRWGWKLTGLYLTGDDYETNNYFIAGGGANQTQVTPEQLDELVAAGLAFPESALTDYDVRSRRTEASVYYRQGDFKATLLYGKAENDGFIMTGVGRNRVESWIQEHYQLELSGAHWYVRYTETSNEAGETYSIQQVPDALAAGLSLEEAKLATRFVDFSEMTDLDARYNRDVGDFSLITGISQRSYSPDSGGTYLPDGPGQGEPIELDEFGAYVQADYRAINDQLRFTAAIRYDDADDFDAEWSPKLGLTYNWSTQHVRLSFNQAHRNPIIVERYIDFMNGLVRGNLLGFDLLDAEGQIIGSVPKLSPEKAEAFEVGYRGAFGGIFAIDAVAHYTKYDNFISSTLVLASPAPGGTVLDRRTGEQVPFLLTFFNYGEAEAEGLDLGFDYFASDRLHLRLSGSYIGLQSFESNAAAPDLSFNTPTHKYKLHLNLVDNFWEGDFINIAARHVRGYDYDSGNWAGRIEPFTFVDLAAGYEWREMETTFKLSAVNLFDSDDPQLIGAPVVERSFFVEAAKRF